MISSVNCHTINYFNFYGIISLRILIFQMYRLPAALRTTALLKASKLNNVQRWYAKDVRFGAEVRALMLQGVDVLADAVAITMGPKVSILPFLPTYISIVVLVSIILNVSFEFMELIVYLITLGKECDHRTIMGFTKNYQGWCDCC